MTIIRKSFLINASNLKAGGGLQVADSICGQIKNFPQHRFIVVLSKFFNSTIERLKGFDNVELYHYDIPTNIKTVILGRDKFLDGLVREKDVQAVLTVFGPSRWSPKVPHLSGFALPQMVIPESPYFNKMGETERIKWWLWRLVRKWSLKRSADAFWTENSYISERLKALLGKNVKVSTVSNYYNQVFDQPEKWMRRIKLPDFSGVTCLSVSANYPHKNFGIIPDVIRSMRRVHPEVNVRFVLTIEEKDMPVDEGVRDKILFIGKVDVSECPYLYEQADIMFMPTLLECFTATYPEAMRMGVPIVTTDLEFARGLCDDAACYYSAVDAIAAAEAIYKVATDRVYADSLVVNGKKRLLSYENYEQRAEKLISILEDISKS